MRKLNRSEKGKEELVDDFSLRFSQIYYRFLDNDGPSKEEFNRLYTILLTISLTKEELLLCGEKNSTQENNIPPYFPPLNKDALLEDTIPPITFEIIVETFLP